VSGGRGLSGEEPAFTRWHRAPTRLRRLATPRHPAPRSILYQRGIYPPESFTPVAKYGLSILVSGDEGLKTYLLQVLRQVSGEGAGGGGEGARG
jgi:hypothetical protein